MKTALIYKNKDAHTYRLEQGLQSVGIKTKIIANRLDGMGDVRGEYFDFLFIDSSLDYNPGLWNASIVSFFDCEDNPYNRSLFFPSVAYNELKDKVKFYTKLNYATDDISHPGMKLCAFPLVNWASLRNLASQDLSSYWSNRGFVPFFVGSPSYIHDYEREFIGTKDQNLNVHCIGIQDDKKILYSQRLQWMIQLNKSGLPWTGGLVFDENVESFSTKFQQKHFGSDIVKFAHPKVDYMSYLSELVKCGIGLNPTGFDRMSWRIYDIMAVGAVLISTDYKNIRMLYMPEEVTIIPDEANIVPYLNTMYGYDLRAMHKAAQKNKELMASLTPDKILKDFVAQYN